MEEIGFHQGESVHGIRAARPIELALSGVDLSSAVSASVWQSDAMAQHYMQLCDVVATHTVLDPAFQAMSLPAKTNFFRSLSAGTPPRPGHKKKKDVTKGVVRHTAFPSRPHLVEPPETPGPKGLVGFRHRWQSLTFLYVFLPAFFLSSPGAVRTEERECREREEVLGPELTFGGSDEGSDEAGGYGPRMAGGFSKFRTIATDTTSKGGNGAIGSGSHSFGYMDACFIPNRKRAAPLSTIDETEGAPNGEVDAVEVSEEPKRRRPATRSVTSALAIPPPRIPTLGARPPRPIPPQKPLPIGNPLVDDTGNALPPAEVEAILSGAATKFNELQSGYTVLSRLLERLRRIRRPDERQRLLEAITDARGEVWSLAGRYGVDMEGGLRGITQQRREVARTVEEKLKRRRAKDKALRAAARVGKIKGKEIRGQSVSAKAGSALAPAPVAAKVRKYGKSKLPAAPAFSAAATEVREHRKHKPSPAAEAAAGAPQLRRHSKSKPSAVPAPASIVHGKSKLSAVPAPGPVEPVSRDGKYKSSSAPLSAPAALERRRHSKNKPAALAPIISRSHGNGKPTVPGLAAPDLRAKPNVKGLAAGPAPAAAPPSELAPTTTQESRGRGRPRKAPSDANSIPVPPLPPREFPRKLASKPKPTSASTSAAASDHSNHAPDAARSKKRKSASAARDVEYVPPPAKRPRQLADALNGLPVVAPPAISVDSGAEGKGGKGKGRMN
ncbi:hypothetical protein BDK51DRAFT_26037 [Blyttiomyces helicus]|uniref:Uncharacterized protein n=1 Tax=Blyttiomyces helicus TaxID=388810 RepID=A0A4P9WKG4_9FUNG|nr:hypothetical protein BDK51DRAFT_26037 [Blyttiomyces helicus]|eukprot:RKO91096.1 hypothetical protein BDK51DRAFT_26037 [Blyttiomyces helicus]